jgi:hypothetical protein
MPVILANWEEEIRRIMVQGQPTQVQQLTSKKLDAVAHTCHPSYTRSINGRIMVQASSSIKVRLYLKSN